MTVVCNKILLFVVLAVVNGECIAVRTHEWHTTPHYEPRATRTPMAPKNAYQSEVAYVCSTQLSLVIARSTCDGAASCHGSNRIRSSPTSTRYSVWQKRDVAVIVFAFMCRSREKQAF